MYAAGVRLHGTRHDIRSREFRSRAGALVGQPTSERPPFDCPDEYGLYPDPHDCHGFYECNEYYPFHFDCPSGLGWNAATSMCDYMP